MVVVSRITLMSMSSGPIDCLMRAERASERKKKRARALCVEESREKLRDDEPMTKGVVM